MIEILSTGAGNSVQDLGRPNYLDQGIGRGGAMDRPALMIANWLAGNDAGAAALEIGLMPFRLRFHAPCRIGLAGGIAETRLNKRRIPPYWSMMVKSGDELRIVPPLSGARLYIAFAGGLTINPVLGSRATDLKSGFGGLDGRSLVRGDRLATGKTSHVENRLNAEFGIDPTQFRPLAGASAASGSTDVRVMVSAEWDDFTEKSKIRFISDTWRVSQEANRQGMRLEGPVLALTRKRELMSHGLMPGTIQVPPSGQPIIQLAEANTCGGYPKIANVIEPDLWKLGQAPSGAELRFVTVTRSQAAEIIRTETAELDRIAGNIEKALKHVRIYP